MHYKRLRRNGRVDPERSVAYLPREKWEQIPGLENRYEASTFGRLRWVGAHVGKTYPGKVVSGQRNRDGYLQLRPFPRPDRRFVRVHQLVALAYLGPCPDGMEINHIDGNRANNTPSNLEYVTHAENVRHAWVTGSRSNRGERNSRARLTVDDVHEIRLLHAAGRSRRELANRFGISPGHVNRIASGQGWSGL